MLKKVPHTYVIVFGIIVISAILTWFIPPGKYVEVTTLVDGREQSRMVFFYEENLPEAAAAEFNSNVQTWQVFSALFNGFVKQSNIIVFILMIGGAFWIMNKSKAIDVGIFAFLKFTKKLENNGLMRWLGVDNVIIVLIMIMFSIFGAVFGMSEETIAFVIILIPLAISMGYDSLMGVSMVYVAAHLGFAGAILNPFTIGIAQGLADLPLFSGIEYRMFAWLVINIVGIAFVLRYAKKIRNKPQSSIMYEEDSYWRKREESESTDVTYYTPSIAWWVYGIILATLTTFSFIYPYTVMTVGNSSFGFYVLPFFTALFAILGILSLKKSVHFFILLLLGYTIVFLIVGVMGYDWYVMEIATLFLAMGIASGLSINKTADEIAILFLEGVKDIMSAAIIVGLAGGIIVVLSDGGIIDSILYGLSKAMGNFGNVASVGVMYIIQTIVNIVIPSGSAKAAITMPIMAPFSDLIGISRQATVMAFQFGDGFTNMITPTSGVLIAVLGIARIPYHKWVRWVWPLIVTLIILGFLLLIPTVTMELNGF
ncbi:MAG: YfcC family protein [Bacteroidetes bacterium]|nr:MAG: YfcC family protein [Bacteroidota bacterium]